MPSNSFNLIHLFILLFNLATTKAQDPTFNYEFCSENKITTNSTYQLNLKTLLSSLSSNSTTKKFYNNTVTGRNPSETVYGLFMCRGDVSYQICGHCVVNATHKLSSDDSQCSSSKQDVIWYDECMVRYSNTSFFSTIDTSVGAYMGNVANISNQTSFMPLLFNIMNQTAYEAANGNSYATKQTNLSEFQMLYTLAQCTLDLSPQDCRICLTQAIEDLSEGKQGGRVLFPSCNIRYELYPFYLDPSPRVRVFVAPKIPVPLPETNYPQKDSNYSEDSGYLSYNCHENVTADSDFQLTLSLVLSDLSSNATVNGRKFFQNDATEKAYGLFMCRCDISTRLCGQCVQNATQQIASRCRLSREDMIWYNHCFLRYSYQSFSSRVNTSPRSVMLNITDASYVEQEYTYLISNALSEMAKQTG